MQAAFREFSIIDLNTHQVLAGHDVVRRFETAEVDAAALVHIHDVEVEVDGQGRQRQSQ
ncbi:hypothetical protein D3C76_1728350 [compost metagenome]